MKIKLIAQLSAAFLAAGLMTMPTVAYADDGDPGDIIWNPADEEVEAIIQAGDTICDGSRYQFTCYTHVRLTNEVMIHYTSRQRRGVGTNFGTFRIARQSADGASILLFDEQGNIVSTMSKTAVVENGPARMYQVFAAAFNGFGGAVAAPLVCAATGCNEGNGGGAVAYSISGAVAESLAGSETTVTVQGGPPAGCVNAAACTSPGQ